MKSLLLFFVCSSLLALTPAAAQEKPDPSLLEGVWKLDMTPENTSDANFAQMTITRASKEGIVGSFYRDGVSIREGRINTQTGILHAALMSGDGTGQYNTAFYYKDGKLYGTTHAVGRDFLSVWTATKISTND